MKKREQIIEFMSHDIRFELWDKLEDQVDEYGLVEDLLQEAMFKRVDLSKIVLDQLKRQILDMAKVVPNNKKAI